MERRRIAAPLMTFATIVGTGFLVFELWRYGYYGSWIANTAFAKTGVNIDPLQRGLAYVGVNVLTPLTPPSS
jgi:hypothetical protein